MKKVVIFDMGGVVVDFEADRLVHQLAQLIHRPFDEVQQAVYHKDLLLPLEIGKIAPQDYYDGLKRSLNIPLTYDQFVVAWNDTLRESPGMVPIVARLRQTHKLFALTNTNMLHIEYMRTRIPSLKAIHGWVASCEVGCAKPDPEIYRITLRRAGVDAGEAVYVDDRPEFVEAGRRVGLTAFRFQSSRQLEQDFTAAGLLS